jgi:EAL domain-containing protein (putative c-di-GMP-specific phosphodiesterase class I)
MATIRSQTIFCLHSEQPIGHEIFHSSLRTQAHKTCDLLHTKALADTLKAIQSAKIRMDSPAYINVSCQRLTDSNRYFRAVLYLLQTLQSAEHTVRIELTEEAAESTLERRVSLLRPLCDQVILDDFGSLSSNFDRLFTIQPDAIKFDQTLMTTTDETHALHGFYQRLLALIVPMNIEIIAEGIETPKQLTYLKSIGITRGQDFYLSKPVIQAFV